jgi:hypothetical protein
VSQYHSSLYRRPFPYRCRHKSCHTPQGFFVTSPLGIGSKQQAAAWTCWPCASWVVHQPVCERTCPKTQAVPNPGDATGAFGRVARCALFTMDSAVLGLGSLGCGCCTVRVFRLKFTLEDAIGPHACSLEANTRVINSIPLGSPLLLPVGTVNCVQTLKVLDIEVAWVRKSGWSVGRSIGTA